MFPLVLFAAALPQIPCSSVPDEQRKAWTEKGLCTTQTAANPVKVQTPGIRMMTRGAGTASATAAPWITANGWRFVRDPDKKYVYEPAAGSAVLAAAEAAAYGVDVLIKVAAEDVKPLGEMLSFIKAIPSDASLKPAANIAVVDEGSRLLPEGLNMMARRNLLFRVVKEPDPSADLTVRIGSPEFPNASAANPAKLADEVRKKLTDPKRLLRIYGTESVLCRLLAGPDHARIFLLNYSTSRVEEVRLRLLGSYSVTRVAVFGQDNVKPADYDVQEGATELTIPVMGPFAVIDLAKK